MNNIAILYAAAKQDAAVTPFNQTDDVCSGYVAWWVRSRLLGKDDARFRGKYFRFTSCVQFPQEMADALWMNMDMKIESSPQGTAKARALQNSFGFPDAPEKVQKYILDGIRDDKREGVAKGVRPIAKLICKKDGMNISGPVSMTNQNGTSGFIESVGCALLRGVVGRYSFLTTGGSHTVGVDCSDKTSIRYFDPNLGFFAFGDKNKFGEWWDACFRTRKDCVNAFHRIQFQFCYEFYEALKS